MRGWMSIKKLFIHSESVYLFPAVHSNNDRRLVDLIHSMILNKHHRQTHGNQYQVLGDTAHVKIFSSLA